MTRNTGIIDRRSFFMSAPCWSNNSSDPFVPRPPCSSLFLFSRTRFSSCPIYRMEAGSGPNPLFLSGLIVNNNETKGCLDRSFLSCLVLSYVIIQNQNYLTYIRMHMRPSLFLLLQLYSTNKTSDVKIVVLPKALWHESKK